MPGRPARRRFASRDRGRARELRLDAFRLGRDGDTGGSLAVVDELVSRYGDSTDPRTRASVAFALVNSGSNLRDMGRADEELARYRDVIAMYGNDRSPEVVEAVGAASRVLGDRLWGLGREDEARATWAQGLAGLGRAESTGIRRVTISTLATRGARIVPRNLEEGIASLREAVDQYVAAPDPTLAPVAVWAMSAMALGYLHHGEYRAAIRVARQARSLFGAAWGTEASLASTGAIEVSALIELDRLDDAREALARLLDTYGAVVDAEAADAVAGAMRKVGDALYRADRSEEALVEFRNARAWLEDRRAATPGDALGRSAAVCAAHETHVLLRQDRPGEALELIGRTTAMLDAMSPAPGAGLRAWLEHERGVALAKLGRWAEALESYEQALERIPAADDLEAVVLPECLLNTAEALAKLGRRADAAAMCDRALAALRDLDIEPELRVEFLRLSEEIRALVDDLVSGEGFVRPFRANDEAALRAVMAASFAFDRFAGFTPGDLEAETISILGNPGGVAVAMEGRVLVGYVSPRHDDLTVHPEHRRRGHGRRLFAQARRLAAEAGLAELSLFVPRVESAEAFARAMGMAYKSSLWRFELAPEMEVPRPDFPPDVRTRAFGDWLPIEHYVSLMNASFADHASPLWWTAEQIAYVHAQPGFDPADVLLVAPSDRADEPIGFARTTLMPPDESGQPVGEIRAIGLLPQWRGRGLGRELLRWSVAHLRSKGAGVVVLSVEAENDRAVELYRGHGFAQVVEWPHWTVPAHGPDTP